MKKTKITFETDSLEEFFGNIREHAKDLDRSENLPAKKRLGILKNSGFRLTEAFWEPLPEEELKLWEGEEDPCTED